MSATACRMNSSRLSSGYSFTRSARELSTAFALASAMCVNIRLAESSNSSVLDIELSRGQSRDSCGSPLRGYCRKLLRLGMMYRAAIEAKLAACHPLLLRSSFNFHKASANNSAGDSFRKCVPRDDVKWVSASVGIAAFESARIWKWAPELASRPEGTGFSNLALLAKKISVAVHAVIVEPVSISISLVCREIA